MRCAFDLIHSRSHPPPNQCCIFGTRVFRNCRQRDNRTHSGDWRLKTNTAQIDATRPIMFPTFYPHYLVILPSVALRPNRKVGVTNFCRAESDRLKTRTALVRHHRAAFGFAVLIPLHQVFQRISACNRLPLPPGNHAPQLCPGPVRFLLYRFR